ncbi:MAG: hypothetical protein ABI422_02715 [Sphingomicrobium sp.]
MSDYKLYCLDGAKRIQRAAEVISAKSDKEAIAQAKALDKPMACEIWHGQRLVATISPARK